jgi:hypothetical protein
MPKDRARQRNHPPRVDPESVPSIRSFNHLGQRAPARRKSDAPAKFRLPRQTFPLTHAEQPGAAIAAFRVQHGDEAAHPGSLQE